MIILPRLPEVVRAVLVRYYNDGDLAVVFDGVGAVRRVRVVF